MTEFNGILDGQGHAIIFENAKLDVPAFRGRRRFTESVFYRYH